MIKPFSGAVVSIHHIDGRTKEGAHKKCLPLCGWHHDVPIPKNSPAFAKYPFVFPIHAKGSVGGRASWEAENGTQEALLAQVMSFIT
ncbi:Ref family recombination enhancement nuclease [uncultured Paraglaciecola sp.]|uniref:Ref family recombination enhancement nuclease n=1 Tax=uncultured Paraglaciecola sp. TaxID=1765024 RepID=UPI0030DBC954